MLAENSYSWADLAVQKFWMRKKTEEKWKEKLLSCVMEKKFLRNLSHDHEPQTKNIFILNYSTTNPTIISLLTRSIFVAS
ncbi:MAG TPA: hypothetical protein DCQ93_04105 [Bacteroidetes bacterium]|nr:hypothetical protein [Bacteroidota bacterium]